MTPVRVLMVEDSLDHIELTQQFLALQGEYHVVAATHVLEFWERLSADDFDVILLDYNLPDGNGLEVLEGLAEHNIKTPVVMITGRGDERVAARTVQAGAADYIIKSGHYLADLPDVIARVLGQARLKRALEEAEARHRDLFELASYGILVCGPDGEIQDANPTLCRWLGIEAKILPGRPMETLERGVTTEAAAARRARLKESITLVWETEFFRSDQTTIPVEVSACLIPRRGGNRPAVIQCFIRDISQRQEMKAEIAAAQGHLLRAARLTAVGELAAGVAHQINNPLTTVIADAQLLLKSIPPEHSGYASALAIYQAGWRAQRVVQRLLNFSRPDEGEFGPTEINATVLEALDLVGAHLERGGVDLRVQLLPDLPLIPANGQQLEEVWINLLMNARDALVEERPGMILLTSRLAPGGTAVEVEVADNGRGIRENERSQLFTLFFTTKGQGRGNGLGLSVCQSIVNDHGGEITFQSREGEGTVFRVRLPLTRSAGGL